MTEQIKEKEDTRFAYQLNFSQLSSMIIKDLNERESNLTSRFTKADVRRFLDNPKNYSKELCEISRVLYNNSSHYKRVVDYFATIATFDYIIEPYALNLDNVNEKAFKTGYVRTHELLDNLNIKHEMLKAVKVAWVNDTFYGYEHKGKNSYFIQRLPNEYCNISSIEDGVYNFSFNFSYFDRNEEKLDTFPPEFTALYRKYDNGSEGEWIELDSKNTICIKINEQLDYDLPPFVGVFASIFEIEDYKALKKTRETIENYKFIIQKIPIREDSEKNNDFLVDLPTMTMFHNKTARILPEEIGLISTPFDCNIVEFSKDRTERNQVVDAERDFYSSTGTSQLLFNGDSSSQANLGKSIKVDEQLVFSVLRQVERWLNRKIKFEVKGAYRFRVKILDITIFNQDEHVDRLLKAAQYGIPVKMMICAALGISPSAVSNMTYLENEVLDLPNSFIPLSSTHTQSGNTPSGRPPSKEDELEPKGEEQRQRDDNANKE
jgi:hypothetical protein